MKTFKDKVKSKSSPSNWGKGGSGHMVGQTGAGPQKSGGTTGSAHNSPGRGFAHGGSGHMIRGQKVKPAHPR